MSIKDKTTSICKLCGLVFHIYPSRLRDVKTKRGVFCSKKCKDNYLIGKPSWNKGFTGEKYKAHYKYGFKGIFLGADPRWKGTRKEYMHTHYWVRKTLGSPDKCENCNQEGFKGKEIHWANLSGKYLEIQSDWIRLCRKCHYIYDEHEKRRSI